jgi:DNA-binding NarL/FixJ family response regulator
VKSIKLLLVEDNPGDQRLALELLQELPTFQFELVTAADLYAGIQQADKQIFDAVLLDLSLPDSQGIDTVLQFQNRCPELPIVVLTGYDDIEQGIKAVNQGAQDYLIKGKVDGLLLMKTIWHSIERKRLLTEREQLVQKLQKALEEIKTLSGMLPICAHCKKIRDDKGYWQQLEGYLKDHADVEFSHGLCPDCIRKLYPELAEEINQKN